MGCLILVIIFLFSIILSEYDIPEEDLPIIGIITSVELILYHHIMVRLTSIKYVIYY